MTSSSVASMWNLASSRAFSALKSAGGSAALGLTYTYTERRANTAPVHHHPACSTGGLTGTSCRDGVVGYCRALTVSGFLPLRMAADTGAGKPR